MHKHSVKLYTLYSPICSSDGDLKDMSLALRILMDTFNSRCQSSPWPWVTLVSLTPSLPATMLISPHPGSHPLYESIGHILCWILRNFAEHLHCILGLTTYVLGPDLLILTLWLEAILYLALMGKFLTLASAVKFLALTFNVLDSIIDLQHVVYRYTNLATVVIASTWQSNNIMISKTSSLCNHIRHIKLSLPILATTMVNLFSSADKNNYAGRQDGPLWMLMVKVWVCSCF